MRARAASPETLNDIKAPIPREAPLPDEIWDEEARERAWRTIQEMLREGDQESAAMLMAQLSAQPAHVSEALPEEMTGEAQPYDPMELYAALAFHYHFSDSEMQQMDWRRLRAYARQLQLMLERQSAPYRAAQKTPVEQEQELAAAQIALSPNIYSGPVVPVN